MRTKSKRLKDKVAMVTGAAHGMGEAEARRFAKEGARVVSTEPAPRCRLRNIGNSHNGCEVQPERSWASFPEPRSGGSRPGVKKEREMADLGLTHVALSVRDLDASVAFYAKYAGM